MNDELRLHFFNLLLIISKMTSEFSDNKRCLFYLKNRVIIMIKGDFTQSGNC